MDSWGIKYSDIDEKWWVDVVLQEPRRPSDARRSESRSSPMGSRA